ncbi:MAG: hypothetical protein JXR51_02085 [Bacteroidales bacterium]|nr:hypothetical protein [Bacteroidales bacterium]MBN2755936.1 hypothetical protein [Bacteroidales bacterium]
MKTKYLLLILLLVFNFKSFSQLDLWTVGTARTIQKNRLEVSAFRPARYGLTNTLEISAQPFVFFFFPNAQIKKNWYNRSFSIATVHGINYPSIFLNIVRKRDYEKIIPVDSVVPKLFVFKNEIIFSKILVERTSCEAENLLLSLKIGVQFALKFGESTLPLIEKPIIYQRTSVYHDKLLWYVGADLDGHINDFLNFSVDVDFLSVGSSINDYAIEHKGIILMPITNSLTVAGGYKISYGSYPSGNKFFIWPLIDISWTYNFKLSKPKQLDLFKNDKMY